eukprot:277528-Heterocapsa_arctica.AAC.1
MVASNGCNERGSCLRALQVGWQAGWQASRQAGFLLQARGVACLFVGGRGSEISTRFRPVMDC